MEVRLGLSRAVWVSLFALTALEASEQDLYDFLWLDKDKKVFVLQNKIHKKKGTHYFNIAYLHDLSSTYQDTKGLQLAYGSYLNEQWALEAFYHKYWNGDSADAEELLAVHGKVPFIRKTDSKIGAVLLWAPFYGKINTFNKILYFDWSFGVGGGVIGGEDNAETVDLQRNKDVFVERSYPSLMAKTALRLYANRRFYAALEYHFDLYNALRVYKGGVESGTDMISNGEVAFGVGVSFLTGRAAVWVLCLCLCTLPSHAQRGGGRSNTERAVNLFYRNGYLYSAALLLGAHLKRGRPLSSRLEHILVDIVSKTGIGSFVALEAEVVRRYGSASPAINFIFGLRAFYRQDFRLGIGLLSRVPRNHPLGLEAIFALGSANALSGNHLRAERYYEQCGRDSLEKMNAAVGADLRRYFALIGEHCTIHRARSLYEREKFGEALAIYKGIPKTSYLWPYVLIEKAWANYKLDNYNRTLGLLATYRSPLMDTYVMPEADVLRGLSYMRLCLWKDAASTADTYKARLRQSRELKRVLGSYKGTDFIREAIRSIQGGTAQDPFVRGMMIQMRKKVRFSLELSGYLRLSKEIKRIGRMKKNPLSLRLGRSLQVLSRVRLGHLNRYIRVQMYRFLNDINRFSIEMAKISIEMTAKEREALYAGKEEKKEETVRLRGRLENVRRVDTEQLYTFDGEFWADELGEYSFALGSRCSGGETKT